MLSKGISSLRQYFSLGAVSLQFNEVIINDSMYFTVVACEDTAMLSAQENVECKMSRLPFSSLKKPLPLPEGR